MTEPIAIIIGAVIGAVIGSLSALVTYKAEKRKRADTLFSSALEYLGGGSQRRNLGIAAVSLYWQEFPEYKQLCAEMLLGAAIYLLSESKQEDAPHEVYNLYRIMALLKANKPDWENRKPYKELQVVIDNRISKGELKPKRGLWVDKSYLEAWRDDLEALMR